MRKNNIWFTADTHFGHDSIIAHNYRPFKSVKHMDDVLINNWLKQVNNNDIVYFLGDFAWKKWYYINILPNLPGNITFVVGNHDYKMLTKEYRNNKLIDIKIDGQHIALSHYPLLTWYQIQRNSYHFHGHCHGSLEKEFYHPRRIDVGVDCWNYKLVKYEELVWKITKNNLENPYKGRVDHHE